MIGVAILGYGTVGSGVYEVIKNNSDVLKRKTGEEIEVLHVLDLREFPNDEVSGILTHEYKDIVEDENVSIVAEVMGGVEVAFEYSKAALKAGKSVVTSNKALVAEHGSELVDLARENKVSYLFEASVGGAIPVLRPIMTSLTADKIIEISGILNGTTNYILSKMTAEGKAFDEVLKTAQDLGYAEADPTADVEGHDACRKIAILSTLAWSKTVDFNKIYTEGITKITDIDIKYAKALDSTIKLIGSSKKLEGGICAKVSPCIIKNSHPLANVNDAYNAIFVEGNMSGCTMYYGSGAGKLPTASAVVADIIDCVNNQGKTISIDWDTTKTETVYEIKDVYNNALIRVATDNVEKAKENIINVFGKAEFVEVEILEIGAIIKGETYGSLDEKVELLKSKDHVLSIKNVISMED